MTIRVKISSDSIMETEVNPLWSGELSDKIERDRIYYLRELKGDFVLIGDDYTLINDLEDECEKVTVTVEFLCGEDWTVFFTGKFTKFDCRFDYYRCKISVKVATDDLYECIRLEWEDAENIYDNTGDAIIVREFFGAYESDLYGCQECRAVADGLPVCSQTDACEEITLEEYNTELCDDPNFPIFAKTWFHRITGLGTPTTPPPYGSGWTLLSGSTWWRCPDEALELKVGVLKYGRLFNSVLTHLTSQVSCGLIVRSHFFGINATHAAPPDNDAYDYADLYYKHMTVHQKSDVKRPDGDPSFSYIWTMKFKDLLADLQTMFNVFWKLDGTSMIVEHISYFEAEAGADYTSRIMPLILEYEVETPKEEKFGWSDEDCTPLFKGFPIGYPCGGEIKERRVTQFSTDMVFIRDEANQDKVSDDRYVLLSNSIDGDSVYFVNDLNAPLSWTNLHDKLHRHYRPFSNGTINEAPVTFDSVQPIKKQPDFTVPLCCDDIPDPVKYITTQLGQARVQTADYNLIKDTLKLQLNY